MNYNLIKRISSYSIISAIICNYCIYSQDCDEGYTYIENLPENVTNINNDYNCFYNDDIAVINELISINTLTPTCVDLGDLNGDCGWNVLDIVTLANCVLDENCETLENGWATDMNDDGYYNVLDIVTLANCVLNEDCEGYTQSLLVGTQTWVTNRLVYWVLTYTPNGSNGINQQLTELPDNFGDLSNLSTLYLEWNNLTELTSSFTQLTNLTNLAISNNYLISLPHYIGDLTNLYYFDLGYNQLATIPESIGNLQNLVYLFLFNNQLTTLPETICYLPLNWDGTDPSNYPYFASGGNQLCDPNLIPDCVENSANFEITLDQFYYSFQEEAPQDCPE